MRRRRGQCLKVRFFFFVSDFPRGFFFVFFSQFFFLFSIFPLELTPSFSEAIQVFLVSPTNLVWDNKNSVFVPWKDHVGYHMLQKLGETFSGYLNICARKATLEEVTRIISKFKCMIFFPEFFENLVFLTLLFTFFFFQGMTFFFLHAFFFSHFF